MLLVWGGDMKQTLSWVWVRAAGADVLWGYEKTVTGEAHKKHYNFYKWIIWDRYYRYSSCSNYSHICVKNHAVTTSCFAALLKLHFSHLISLLRNLRRLFFSHFSFFISQSLTQEGAGDELRHLVPRAAHLWQVSQLPVQHPLELKKTKRKGNTIIYFLFFFITPAGAKIWTFLLRLQGNLSQNFQMHIISNPLPQFPFPSFRF